MSDNQQINDESGQDKLQDAGKKPAVDLQEQPGTSNRQANHSDQSRLSSTPIDIQQVQGGKFGVLHVRQPIDPFADGTSGEPVPIDKIVKTANTMTNMMMAHRIALEDDFKLEPGLDMSGPLMSLSPIIGSSPSANMPSRSPAGEPSLQSRVKDIVLEAYWNLFAEELATQSSKVLDDRKYDMTKQLICDIQKKITDLLPPRQLKLKHEIDFRLDQETIDRLIKVGEFNLVEYLKYILEVVPKLCAPIRDQQVEDLKILYAPFRDQKAGELNYADLVPLLRGIMELLECMRLDFANFTLQRFKPHIKAHSIEYEREKFNEILQRAQKWGVDGLEYTKTWLDRAVKRIDSIHGLSDLLANSGNLEAPLETQPNSQDGTCSKKDLILRSDIVDKVLNSAYCELLEWSSEPQKFYPETLLFDEATFKELGNQYHILLLTSSTLLVSFALINKFKLQGDEGFKSLVKSHVITLLTASYNESSLVVGESSTGQQPSSAADIDRIKLETVATKVCDDIKQKLHQQESNLSLLEQFESQKYLLKGQILELQNSSNRVRELARRRILEFIDTLLVLDIKHQQRKFANSPPPVNIPLGLNCLAAEMTATMAQLVKIVRYNRKVFYDHYEKIIVELVSKTI